MGNSATKQHEKRVQRCMVSFQQLQADIRHINVNCAMEFARTAATADGAAAEPLVLQFRPFTKLSKKSSLPWLWKVNDNVIVSATIMTKREAEAMQAAAAAGSAAPGPAVSSTVAPASSLSLLPSVSRCYTLTLHDFYELFISFVDSVKLVTTLREQILKIEQPAVWEAKQEARRREVLQARAKKQSVGGHDDNLTLTASAAVAAAGAAALDEQKDEHKAAPAATSSSAASSSLAPSSLSRNSSADSAGLTFSRPTSGECCICLTAPDEEALGEELVVLSCMHAFCPECIAEWRAHSPTCPLCRRDLEDAEEDSGDSWILTSPNLADLKSSLARLVDFPFDFVTSKPAFPPRENSKGVKSAGDAFSLVVGEAIDVFETATRRRSQKQQQAQPQQQPAQAKLNQPPVAAPATMQPTAGAVSPPAPKQTTTTTAQSTNASAPSTLP